jgi:cell division protein FtsN
MWNLTGDDIQRAKEELKGRRDAIKAHYDDEMKKLEADIADIETFERAAVNFVSNFKGEDEPAVTIADPEPATERGAAGSVSEQSNSTIGETPVEESAEAEPVPQPAPEPEPVAHEKSSSRWRMRLNATEGSR